MGWIKSPRSTGWRDISDLLTSGWTGSVYAKRTGTTVTVRVHGLSAAAATGHTPLTFPIGFRPEAIGTTVSDRPLWHRASNPIVVRRSWISSGGSLRFYDYDSADVLYGDARFDTADPWPTGLLGVST